MRRLMLILVAMVTIAPVASAQTGRHVSLGVGFTFHSYTDQNFHQKNPGLSPVYRLAWHPGMHDGLSWEPELSAGWVDLDVRTVVAGARNRIGRLHAVPVLVGGGPAYRHGRVRVGGAVLAGASFHSFTPDPGVPDVDVKTGFALRPQASLWYDVSSRLGLHTGVSYLYCHPSVSPSNVDPAVSGKWKTDRFNVSAGFAIGLF